jgi:hypothetical protein
MGIGPTALKLYDKLVDEGIFRPDLTVCELGAQTYVPRGYGNWPRMVNAGARVVYERLGMFEYTCIDLNGERGAMPLDLNTVEWTWSDRFDIVTNHGTTEHVMNQLNCFRLMHDMTKLGGLMIHAVPTSGYYRHGFFSYSAVFFEDLAHANAYEIIKCYDEEDRDGTLIVVVLRKTADGSFVVPMQRIYGAIVPERVSN